MLYHVSKTGGIKVLTPHVSTHKKAYVYAVENSVTGLLFGVPHDDFDFFINEENGKALIMECYPDAFGSIFKEKSCYIYEVAENGFVRGMTSWDSELVSENEVEVLREIRVEDIYSRLLEEESNGNLIIRRYENTEEYKTIVSRHIVDRLIRFDLLDTENERIKKHYGKIIDALKSIMDGHLL